MNKSEYYELSDKVLDELNKETSDYIHEKSEEAKNSSKDLGEIIANCSLLAMDASKQFTIAYVDRMLCELLHIDK